MLKMDGFDDCVVGTVTSFGINTVLAYDVDMVIQKMIREWELTADEAWEYHEYNQLGAYMGEGTPVFIRIQNLEAIEFDLDIGEN